MGGSNMAIKEPNWSLEEKEVLSHCYLQVPIESLSKVLRRTKESIYSQVKKLGISNKCYKQTDEDLKTIKRLHSAGHLDPEISKLSGLDINVVRRLRRKLLKLPSNNNVKKAISRLKSYQKKTKLEKEEFAAQYNLPKDLKVQEVVILVTLAHHGVMTGRQISSVVGLSLKSAQIHYLSNLTKKGLIVYNKLSPTKGFYMLTMAAMDMMSNIRSEVNAN
jgi:predicted transcriptional regulator